MFTPGHQPSHRFKAYLQQAAITVQENVSDGKQAVVAVMDGFGILLNHEALLDISTDAGDEGTNALMSDYIRQQEKLL